MISARVRKPRKNSRSLIIVALFVVLGLGAAMLIRNMSGWRASAQAKKLKNPVPATETALAAGKLIYTRHCRSCHGESGDGKGEKAESLFVKPTDFMDAHKMDQATDGELFWTITKGRRPMPGFEDKLSDEQRWQLVDYIRAFARKSSGAPASAPLGKSAASK